MPRSNYEIDARNSIHEQASLASHMEVSWLRELRQCRDGGQLVRVRVLACMHARTCARACVFASCMHARVSMCNACMPDACMEGSKREERGWDGEVWAEEEQG